MQSDVFSARQDSQNIAPDTCVLCGDPEFEVVWARLRHDKKGQIVRCVSCGLVRLLGAQNRQPFVENFYKEQYRKEYFENEKQNLDSQFAIFASLQKARIDKLKKYLKCEDSVLEIGSGPGYFLSEIGSLVKQVQGVELNQQEARFAREKGIPTENCSIQKSSLPHNTYDHVCCFQTLEHVPDPISFLRHARQFLKTGGYISIEAPNIFDPLVACFNVNEYKNFYFHEPHLYYFSPDSLRSVIQTAGLEAVELYGFQQTSILNHMNWIYARKPMRNRLECTKTELTAFQSEAPKELVEDLSRTLDQVNHQYSKLLQQYGYADNIFCVCRPIK